MHNIGIRIQLIVFLFFLFIYNSVVFSQDAPTFNGQPIALPTDELTIEYILSTLNRAVTKQSPEQLQTLKDNGYKRLWVNIPSTAMLGMPMKDYLQTLMAVLSYHQRIKKQHYLMNIDSQQIFQ